MEEKPWTKSLEKTDYHDLLGFGPFFWVGRGWVEVNKYASWSWSWNDLSKGRKACPDRFSAEELLLKLQVLLLFSLNLLLNASAMPEAPPVLGWGALHLPQVSEATVCISKHGLCWLFEDQWQQNPLTKKNISPEVPQLPRINGGRWLSGNTTNRPAETTSNRQGTVHRLGRVLVLSPWKTSSSKQTPEGEGHLLKRFSKVFYRVLGFFYCFLFCFPFVF